jgi:hypothetical protein
MMLPMGVWFPTGTRDYLTSHWRKPKDYQRQPLRTNYRGKFLMSLRLDLHDLMIAGALLTMRDTNGS